MSSIFRNCLLKTIAHKTSHKANICQPRISGPYYQRRYLNLQEYQSKQLLDENGVRVQRFKVVENEEQVLRVLNPDQYGQFEGHRWSGSKGSLNLGQQLVIKAQILAGGRGKGYFSRSGMRGVHLTEDLDSAKSIVTSMLNDHLVTKQTGPDGVLVERVMIAEAVDIKDEYYLAIVLDRSYDLGPIFVTSRFGGMDIEDAAAKDPFSIKKFTIPIGTELDIDTARRMVVAAYDLSMSHKDIIEQIAQQMIKLHELFLKLDAVQIEINPLAVTREREVMCIDAKINFDENARFRQKWLDDCENANRKETDKRDFEAKKHNLNYIGLDGSIGCLVNGAGLAMATMDLIKLHGGEPANFLDVGGGASVDQVRAAFGIIESDPKVLAIFVNIFGGIMRCDTVAQGIIEATKSMTQKLPIVVRLEGTRVEEARKLIEQSGLNIIIIDDLDKAAERVVGIANKDAK